MTVREESLPPLTRFAYTRPPWIRMSTGFFLSIRESYVAEEATRAKSLLKAINASLSQVGQRAIADGPDAPHVCDGRTSDTNIHRSTLAKVGKLAGDRFPHLGLLATKPHRVVYAPREFADPLETAHEESIAGRPTRIRLGSSHALHRELLAIAPELGIPLDSGRLSDRVAHLIDGLESLSDDDDDELVEKIRVAWLMMHEAAMLSMDREVPIALAT